MKKLLILICTISVTDLFWAQFGYANTTQKHEKVEEICVNAVRARERRDAIPSHLLNAISQVESGRWDKKTQANIAWPWTVSSGGNGKYFKTKMEAVAEVEFLITDGIKNIDVGCMQINLAAHADAFQTIEDALDPESNVAYGAQYLKAMHQRTGDWLKAAGDYHSRTPGLSTKYRTKVSRAWNHIRQSSAQNTGTPQVQTTPPTQQQSLNSGFNRVHLNHLNKAFRERVNHSIDEIPVNPVSRRNNKRQDQITAWRRAVKRGNALSALAVERQAAAARKRKRQSTASKNKNRPAVLASLRRQYLKKWRVRYQLDAIKD